MPDKINVCTNIYFITKCSTEISRNSLSKFGRGRGEVSLQRRNYKIGTSRFPGRTTLYFCILQPTLETKQGYFKDHVNSKLYFAPTEANVKIKIVLNSKACNIHLTHAALHLDIQFLLNFTLSITVEKRDEM